MSPWSAPARPGYAAAKTLRRAGRSFVVLEARDRIGGRAFTDDTLGAPFDAGAHYIHWAERNPWKKIAEELKVPLEEDGAFGMPLVFANGVRLAEDERARRRGAFGRVWRALEAGVSADRSFAEAVKGAPPEIVGAAGGITQFSLGEDPERVSIADYEQLWSGDDYAVPSGYGALVARCGADVPVRLSTPVEAIRWDGKGVAIETAAGHAAGRGRDRHRAGRRAQGRRHPLRARPARAVAGGARRARHGRLHQDRPQDRPRRIEPLEASDYIEIVDGGAVSFEFWPFGRDLCLVLLGGDHARRLCEAGERAAIDFATERLAGMARRPCPRGRHGRAPRRLVDRPLRPRQLLGRAARPRRRAPSAAAAGRRPHLPRRRGERRRRRHDGRRRDPRRPARRPRRHRGASLDHGSAAAPAQGLTLP